MINSIRSNENLIDFIGRTSQDVDYTFFWRGAKPRKGVSESCMSQWYPSPFSIANLTFPTAEHYMMATKAALHNDEASIDKILKARHPSDAKRLGRKVKNYDDDKWHANRMNVVVTGTYEKFNQNPELKEYLLSTGNNILVEASPVDDIWGIGMAEGASNINDPTQWKGLNLLGYALMEARDRLRKDQLADTVTHDELESRVGEEVQVKTPTKEADMYPYKPYRSMYA